MNTNGSFAKIDKIHDFDESLAFSRSQRGKEWWEKTYRLAFHNFQVMGGPEEDGWCEKSAVDRKVMLTSGKVIQIQEKVRKKSYPDFCLEYETAGRPGWIQHDSDADYLAYAQLPTGKCWLFPFPILRAVWRKKGQLWLGRARLDARTTASYRNREYTLIETTSQRYGQRWKTRNVAVPRDELLEAVKNAMFVQSTPFVDNEKSKISLIGNGFHR